MEKKKLATSFVFTGIFNRAAEATCQTVTKEITTNIITALQQAGCKEPQAISPCEEQKCWAAVTQKRKHLCEPLISREWSRTLILWVCLRLAERYTSELDCIGLTQLYVVISSRINWTAADYTYQLCRNHIWACYHIIILALTCTVTLQYNNKLTNVRSAVTKFILRQVCLAVILLFKFIP